MKLGAVVIEPSENETCAFSASHRQFSCLTRSLLAPALGLSANSEKPSAECGVRCPILTLGQPQILGKCKSQIPNGFYPNLICSISNLIQRVPTGGVCFVGMYLSGVHLRYRCAPQVWAWTSGMGVHLIYGRAPHVSYVSLIQGLWGHFPIRKFIDQDVNSLVPSSPPNELRFWSERTSGSSPESFSTL